MLLFVEVIADFGRELLGEVTELVGGRVDAAQLLDQLLGLVVVGEGVAGDAESGVVHQQRDVEVPLLGRGVGVELVGEGEEGGPVVVRGRRGAWVIGRASVR